jgi:hypothetical protein
LTRAVCPALWSIRLDALGALLEDTRPPQAAEGMREGWQWCLEGIAATLGTAA